jgi:hypothetical protein
MSETLQLELEARILWKTGRLLRFLKWPSADEVDFGEFLVEFEFKQGLIRLRYPDGQVLQIGSFTAQKRGTNITSIVGPIRVADDYFVELKPATSDSDACIRCSMVQGEEWSQELQMNQTSGEWNVSDRVSLVSVVEGRDAFLKVLYAKESMELAVILASLTVFLRFSH